MSKKKATNDKGNTISINFNSKTISIIIAVLGLVLLIITSAIDIKDETGAIKVFLFNITESVGLTLLSAGLVSILMEISTVESVVNKAIRNVFSVDVPLDAYSETHLKKLKDVISSHISKRTPDELKQSVYKLEPHLLNLTSGLYYEYHNIRCTVIPKDKENVFLKKVTMIYKIVNEHDLENKVKIGISLHDYKSNMTDDERLNSVIIKRFEVNKTNLINDPDIFKTVEPLNSDDSYEYDYRYVFERSLQKCREHEVLLEYEYITTQNDLTQTWKLVHPCKKTEHTICIKDENPNGWLLKASAFASFYHNSSPLEKKFKVDQAVDNNVKIEFNDWTIPGAGYVVSYVKK